MLKTILSVSPELDFADELFLLCPRWLHKDLKTTIRENIGSLDDPDIVDRLVDLLFSGEPYGWFWTCPEEQLDREFFADALRSRPVTLPNLFDAIITEHARKNGKSGRGAKFPTHYSYTPTLLEWYPECKLIHTTRNPKAVYASQSAKYLTGDMSAARRAFLRFQQFVHINIQTAWTAKIHRDLAGHPNYCLVRYEDVITDGERTIRDVCEFLEVPFQPEMLAPHQYGSSFSSIGGKSGIDDSSLNRWKNSISGVSQSVMDVLHSRSYKLLGYEHG
jgi:hypothetical protein